MGYEIRAMSFAEIMDTGFRIVRQHFGLIIGIAAALYVPIAILGALVAPEPVPGSGPWASVGAGRVGFLIGLVLYAVVVSPIVSAAPIAGTSILVGIAVMIGLVLLVIPGVYLFLCFLLVWQVMVLERRYGFAAMGRSRELMRGSLLRGFGITLAGAIIVSVVGGAIALVVGHVPLLGPIGEGVARAAGVAYTSAVAVVLYFDIRCRKEAFDLEHLARLVAGPEGSAEVV
ncbi:MAG: hypothetical protein DMD97_27695 [Candidatus Rokuibacteriota bacterium]|nr:MAG: hypothetical protein DMD97_27695 [Candidatus Rokubacteria bacterium]